MNELVPTDFGPPSMVSFRTPGGGFGTREWLPGEKELYRLEVLFRKPSAAPTLGNAEWAKPK